MARGQAGCLKQAGAAELINHNLGEMQLMLRIAGQRQLYQIQTFFTFCNKLNTSLCWQLTVEIV